MKTRCSNPSYYPSTGRVIGHYTQYVWAKTFQVGCGVLISRVAMNDTLASCGIIHHVSDAQLLLPLPCLQLLPLWQCQVPPSLHTGGGLYKVSRGHSVQGWTLLKGRGLNPINSDVSQLQTTKNKPLAQIVLKLK